MTETRAEIRWDLGFAYAEVVSRLGAMLSRKHSPYQCEHTAVEARFHAILPGQGRVELRARPVEPSGPLRVVHQRTVLDIRFEALDPGQEKAFLHDLNIAFLRLGG